MSLLHAFSTALDGVARNKLRSFLTMLGVIIGVAAVISLVSIGEGARASVSAQIQALGSDLVIVQPVQPYRLRLDDVDFMLKKAPVAAAAPSMTRQLPVKWSNRSMTTTIDGVSAAYYAVRNLELEDGRFVSDVDVDGRRRVAVIGETVKEELFAGTDPVGEQLRINGQPFTVVGVLAKKGSVMGVDNDSKVFIPITTAQSVFGVRFVQVVYLQLEPEAKADQAVAMLEAAYEAKNKRANTIRVQSQEQLLQTVGNVTRTMSMMLAGIASVSLLVGGIGIMNIMLVSVAERTREIGIRRAVGARRADVLAQFLIEAIALSSCGGALGILLGAGGAQAARSFGLNTLVSPDSVLVAFCFAVAVGVVFGLSPALTAARLDPIAALRHE